MQKLFIRLGNSTVRQAQQTQQVSLCTGQWRQRKILPSQAACKLFSQQIFRRRDGRHLRAFLHQLRQTQVQRTLHSAIGFVRLVVQRHHFYQSPARQREHSHAGS